MTARYVHGHHESVLRSHRWRTAENSAGYLLDRLHAGMSLLDVGCGPGTITADLAARVAPGPVLAIDPAQEAVEATRLLLSGRAAPSVQVRRADVAGLRAAADHDPAGAGVPDGGFDVVHAHQVLQYVDDPVALLRDLAALARPGGVVAARDADYRGFAWYPLLPELQQWQDLYQRVARADGGEPDAGRHLLAWARAAGLTDLTPSASVWCFATDADRQWWGGLWADRALHSSFAEHALDRGLATRADLRRISDGWRRWAASDDAWLAVPHGEVVGRAPGAPS